MFSNLVSIISDIAFIELIVSFYHQPTSVPFFDIPSPISSIKQMAA